MTNEEKGTAFYNLLVGFLIEHKLWLVSKDSETRIIGMSQKDSEIRMAIEYINMRDIKDRAIEYGDKIDARLNNFFADLASKTKVVEHTMQYCGTNASYRWNVEEYSDGSLHCDCPIFARNGSCHHTICYGYLIKDTKPEIMPTKIDSTAYLSRHNLILTNVSYIDDNSAFSSTELYLMAYMICYGYSIGDIKRKYNLSLTGSKLIKQIEPVLDVVYKEQSEEMK